MSVRRQSTGRKVDDEQVVHCAEAMVGKYHGHYKNIAYDWRNNDNIDVGNLQNPFWPSYVAAKKKNGEPWFDCSDLTLKVLTVIQVNLTRVLAN